MIHFAAAIPLLGTGLGLTACGSSEQSELTMGMVTFPGYAPLYVANQLNLFGTLKVNLVRIESIGDLRAAMLSNRIDAYLATYDIYQSIQGRAPVGKMIYAIDTSVGADGVVADASIKDVAGIVGETVGVEPGFPPHFVLTYMLYKLGRKLSDATLVDMPSGDVPSAFSSGKIKVAATYEPYLSKCLQLRAGAHVLASSANLPGLVTDFIVASDAALGSKRAELVALIEGWDRALTAITARPDEAYKIMGAAFNVPPSEMKEFAGVVKWLSAAENKAMFSDGAETSVYRRFDEVNAALRLNDPKVTSFEAKQGIVADFVMR